MTKPGIQAVLLLLACLLLSACASSPPTRVDTIDPRYAAIDQHALSVNGRVTRDVDRLARELTRPARNEEEKARAIYRWLAENIEYDVRAWSSRNGIRAPHRPDDVLKAKRAVCEGFARTFVALASAAGLEAVYITGHARVDLYDTRQNSPDAYHAWNAVRINNEWRLLDVTWAAGIIDERTGRYSKRLDDHWFMTPPEQMIKTHYPKHRGWQLLRHPITFTSFIDQPRFWTNFFNNGLQLDSHNQGYVRMGGETTISLRAPEHIGIIAWLDQRGRRLPDTHTLVVSANGQHTVHVAVPQSGDYVLTILAGDRRRGPMRYTAMQYHLSASGRSHSSFPKLGPAFARDQWTLPRIMPAAEDDPSSPIRAIQASLDHDAVAWAELRHPASNSALGRSVLTWKEGTMVTFAFAPPAPDDYELVVFSKPAGRGGNYDFAFSVPIRLDSSLVSHFPQIHHSYSRVRASLISPLAGDLSAGRMALFDLQSPVLTEVAVVNQGRRQWLERNGQRFTANLRPARGSLEIVGRKPGSDQLFLLAQYTVR